MQPIVNGLQEEYRGRLVVEQVDANTPEGRVRLQAYGLRGHPGFVLVDADGTVRWRFTGQMDGERLRQQIEAHLEPR